MDNKKFGIYALIIAAVVLIAIGFNNVTGQVGKTACLTLEPITSEGGAHFKVTIDSSVTKFDNHIYIDNIGLGESYNAYFDCGQVCNIATLKKSKNGITKKGEVVTPTKTIMPACPKDMPTKCYKASITDPCTGKEITSSFTIK